MSLAAQAKFLRVLQEREFQRLGGTRILKANIRVIAATNRDLRKAVERGDFREDLFYRLKVFDIAIPPLRERAADILPLSETLLQDIGKSFAPAAGGPHARRPGGAAPVPLARQRPRAPQRARARGHSVRRRAHRRGAPRARSDGRSHRAPCRPISARSSATRSLRSCANAAGTGRAPPSASASRALSSICGCRSMGSRSRPTRKRPAGIGIIVTAAGSPQNNPSRPAWHQLCPSIAAEHACDDRTVDVMYDHRASLASNDPPVPITFRNSRFARRDLHEFNRLLKRPAAFSLLEHLLPPFTCHNGLSNRPRRIAASIPLAQNRSQARVVAKSP